TQHIVFAGVARNELDHGPVGVDQRGRIAVAKLDLAQLAPRLRDLAGCREPAGGRHVLARRVLGAPPLAALLRPLRNAERDERGHTDCRDPLNRGATASQRPAQLAPAPGLRGDRVPGEEAIEIVAESGRRWIAMLGRLLETACDDACERRWTAKPS